MSQDIIDLKGDIISKYFLIQQTLNPVNSKNSPTTPNMKVRSITFNNYVDKDMLENINEIVAEHIKYEYISEGYVEALNSIKIEGSSIKLDASQFIKFKFLNTSLKEVHQKDIKPYQNLQILQLNENHIEVIEGDLFDANHKLKEVNLQNNRIWFIHANAVTKLKNIPSLEFLLLLNNACINKDYKHPPTKANGQDISEVFGICVLNYYTNNSKKYSKDTERGSRINYQSEMEEKFKKILDEKITLNNIERDQEHKNEHTQLKSELDQEVNTFKIKILDFVKSNVTIQRQEKRDKEIADIKTELKAAQEHEKHQNATIFKQQEAIANMHVTINQQQDFMEKLKSNLTGVKELISHVNHNQNSQKADPISEPQKSSSPTDVVLSTVTAILIFLMILMMIFFFIKRDKFIVMSKSYSVADCDMMSRNESSTTVEFDFIAGDDEKKRIKATTDDFCLQSKTEKSVPVESKAGPSRLLFDSSTTAEIQLLPPPISPRGVRPISMLNAPKIPPTIPPKHSSILKPKPKAEKSHGENYDKVWEANTEDDGYIELSEIQKIRSDASE